MKGLGWEYPRDNSRDGTRRSRFSFVSLPIRRSPKSLHYYRYAIEYTLPLTSFTLIIIHVSSRLTRKKKYHTFGVSNVSANAILTSYAADRPQNTFIDSMFASRKKLTEKYDRSNVTYGNATDFEIKPSRIFGPIDFFWFWKRSSCTYPYRVII